MMDVKVHGWEIPKNTALDMFSARFRSEYPELSGCEIKETAESCEDCGFCDLNSDKEANDE